MSAPEVWLVRHGETEWSASGQHTGKTDLPLNARGVAQAERLVRRLAARPFSLVLTSPRARARETCRLAGYGAKAIVDEDLAEWDYGAYEGRTSRDIRAESPGWNLWLHGAPGGETREQVAARVDRAIERVVAIKGDVAIFAHGHLLRMFVTRWLRLPPERGGSFDIGTASLGVVAHDAGDRVLRVWNDTHHLDDTP